MGGNNIEKFCPILKESLDYNSFLISLMTQAHKYGLLDDNQIETKRAELLNLWVKQLNYYTNEESSSVKESTAKMIFDSVYYTISLQLRSYDTINKSIEALKNESLDDLFKFGKKKIYRKVRIARLLHYKILKNRIQIPLQCYNSVIDNEIKNTFRTYNMDFASNDININYGYSVYKDLNYFMGIEGLIEYLNFLCIENEFCSLFDNKAIKDLMFNYNHKYSELCINIFEKIFINSIGCALTHKRVSNLKMTYFDVQNIKNFFANFTQDQVNHEIKNAIQIIIKELNIKSNLLKNYLNSVSSKISKILFLNFQNESIFIYENIPKEKTYFSSAPKMQDEKFRLLIEEIRSCRFISDKISLIKQEIKSLDDIYDLLDANCLFADEFINFYATLTDYELALLLKKATQNVDTLDTAENNWKNYLNKYLLSIDKSRYQIIKNICLTIECN